MYLGFGTFISTPCQPQEGSLANYDISPRPQKNQLASHSIMPKLQGPISFQIDQSIWTIFCWECFFIRRNKIKSSKSEKEEKKIGKKMMKPPSPSPMVCNICKVQLHHYIYEYELWRDHWNEFHVLKVCKLFLWQIGSIHMSFWKTKQCTLPTCAAHKHLQAQNLISHAWNLLIKCPLSNVKSDIKTQAAILKVNWMSIDETYIKVKVKILKIKNMLPWEQNKDPDATDSIKAMKKVSLIFEHFQLLFKILGPN